jgi:hypothetical protein
VAARWHSKAVDLRLDVDSNFCISLEPSDIDFNIKVTDAITPSASQEMPAGKTLTCKQ